MRPPVEAVDHIPGGRFAGWTAVVLAAGRGSRMRSATPKPLHAVAGRSMLALVVDAVRAAGCGDVVVVAAQPDDAVAAAARALGARVVPQGDPGGTGHATVAARDACAAARHVLIVNADLPLLRPETLRALAAAHAEGDVSVTFLTAHLDDPAGYGRVLREEGVLRIVEERELGEWRAGLREVNVGVYAADASWLWPALDALAPAAGGERYLTDIVAAAAAERAGTRTMSARDSSEVRQVNTRVELAHAEALLRARVRERLMLDGVTMLDPPSTFVDATVTVGADTTLLPGVHLLGETHVGGGCRIGPGAVLRDMTVGERCEISGSTLEGSTLADGVTVGPYCHVRPGSVIEAGVHLGNYAEVKASRIGARTQVGHFSYIGDAELGPDVNIGAGAVTCNFDGVAKHRTIIGAGAFIGSDSMLVAPVRVGAGARTAAGAVVTADVPDGALVMGVPARIRGEREGG